MFNTAKKCARLRTVWGSDQFREKMHTSQLLGHTKDLITRAVHRRAGEKAKPTR